MFPLSLWIVALQSIEQPELDQSGNVRIADLDQQVTESPCAAVAKSPDEFLRVYCSAFASPVVSCFLWICNFKRLTSVSRASRDECANARSRRPD
jgi:hypothetical protein